MKRKPPFITLALIVLAILLGAASGPVGSAIELPSQLKPFALPLFLTLAFLLSLVAVIQFFLQQEKTEVFASSIDRQNRQRLISRVRLFWITGVLDQSLLAGTLIALNLQNQPDALADPWRLVLQEKKHLSYDLPTGAHITQVYDKAALGELLILGEPGCGKTTLLLELARDLLCRAEQDESHPIPIVFSLSSWAVKRQPLSDWLIEEMNTKYQVPRRLAQEWVNADQVLPLLDGLDEVAAPHRAACVESINTFRQEHGLVPLVVCSRREDYLALKLRLVLDYAIVVQPLAEKQIDEYLSNAGGQLEGVRTALNSDPSLREMATTPLLLSVLTLAYQGRSVKEIEVTGPIEIRRQQLFSDYVAAMLQRRGTETRYTSQQTISWLIWLASQMVRHDQTVFYIERLQPDWLPVERSRITFLVGTVMFVGVFSGLLGGLFDGILHGPAVGVLVGVLCGLLGGLLVGYQRSIEPIEVHVWSKQSVRKALFVGVFVGVLAGVYLGLLTGLLDGLGAGLFTGLLYGQLAGLVVGLFVVLRSRPSREKLDTNKLGRPNFGIWRSALYGGIVWLFVGLFFGLFLGLLRELYGGLLSSMFDERVTDPLGKLLVGLLGGSLVGLLVGLPMGGGAFIKHFILRWFLWYAGLMPWNYPQFLDYAARCIFLRKVGGGYTFVHRLLLEYFASQASQSAPSFRK